MLFHSGYAMSQWLCYVAVAMLCRSGYAMSQWLCYVAVVMSKRLCYVALAMLCHSGYVMSQWLCRSGYAMLQWLCYVAVVMSKWLCYVAVALPMVMLIRTFRVRLPFALSIGRCQIQATFEPSYNAVVGVHDFGPRCTRGALGVLVSATRELLTTAIAARCTKSKNAVEALCACSTVLYASRKRLN